MKSLAVLGLMLILLAGTASGQFSWRQTAGPNGGSVLSMVKDQHGRLLAGCQFGAIYHVAPNGNAWLRVNPGMTDRDIAGMACSPVDGAVPSGTHVQLVDGSSLANGIYLYRLSAGGAVLSRRMMLIK